LTELAPIRHEMVAFGDGRLIERSGAQTSEWGTVTEWEPGERVSFSGIQGVPRNNRARSP
jgi:hypothetical protein